MRLDRKSATKMLALLAERQDLLLVGLLVLAIFMMILPLPTAVVDTLIAVNMGMTIMMLMVAVYLRDPLSFSTLPSVILLLTVFRLSLSITTTRLILVQADAGRIVETFGNFVVAGNLVVGLVVFLIITIVQFVVITKGAERIAEVSARFSLDALPGKQMSIDSDLRSGVIDVGEARRRRNHLQKESQLYGAMDGAMKFVKGDAIAGLVIIAVNLIGGVAVGTLQDGMSIGTALQVYALLTVGDGLIAQIPALFVSITSGTTMVAPAWLREHPAGTRGCHCTGGWVTPVSAGLPGSALRSTAGRAWRVLASGGGGSQRTSTRARSSRRASAAPRRSRKTSTSARNAAR